MVHGMSIEAGVAGQARSGLYGEEYFKSLSDTLSSRRNAFGVYTHYGYADESASFKEGMWPGSNGTTDIYSNGYDAQQKLAMPIHRLGDIPPNAFYAVTIDLTKVRVDGPSPVVGREWSGFGLTVTRSGGGSEVLFPGGTPPGSVSDPVSIPTH